MGTQDETRLHLASHLSQWQTVAKKLALELQPVLQAQAKLAAEQGPRLAAAIQPIIDSIDQIRIQEFATQAISWQQAIQESLRPALDELQRTFRDLPPRIRSAVITLATHGWYLDDDMDMPQIWELERALTSGNVTAAEEVLASYYESRVDLIESVLTDRFAHRAHLLKPAFLAYRRGEHALAVPVLLAQVDGICKDLMGEYLFLKKDKRPQTAQYVEQFGVDSFTGVWLAALAETTPINASEKERAGDEGSLNRHRILHGEALDYDTRVNSLKVMSLAYYVVSAIGPTNPDT